MMCPEPGQGPKGKKEISLAFSLLVLFLLIVIRSFSFVHALRIPRLILPYIISLNIYIIFTLCLRKDVLQDGRVQYRR